MSTSWAFEHCRNKHLHQMTLFYLGVLLEWIWGMNMETSQSVASERTVQGSLKACARINFHCPAKVIFAIYQMTNTAQFLVQSQTKYCLCRWLNNVNMLCVNGWKAKSLRFQILLVSREMYNTSPSTCSITGA